MSVRHEGAAHALPKQLDLVLATGEVVLLLGPSGSGKSTLTLAANGTVPQIVPGELTGSVVVAGQSTRDTPVPRLARNLGMVFQDADASVITGTVLDEVWFGPENQLNPAQEVVSRAESALRRVGLWHRRLDNPDRLSGGGRQRLAIACALALGAPLLVLDEPTANLDPAGVQEFYATLTQLVSAGDLGVLLVEHNLDQCVQLVDRVVVLDQDGRQAFSGPTREVLVDRAAELAALGVWLPVATRAAMQLRAAGTEIDQLPVTPEELTGLASGLVGQPPPVRLAVEASAIPRPRGEIPSAGVGAGVTVSGLTIRRGDAVLLDQIDLSIEPGEWVALVGTNGAGKTTLLQAIAGVVRPPKRRIWVGGIDPGRVSARELSRRIGFVFQNPEHQFIRSTVGEELGHALELQGEPTAVIDTRVEAMLERLDLVDHRHQHPFLLSGGQKRRLSVGTALIGGAEILALDEPTFGQDAERAAEVVALLDEVNTQGTTVVMATHDLQLVADHAQRMVVLAGGRLQAVGQPAQLLSAETLIPAGLRLPPLAAAMSALPPSHPWHTVTRLAQLPGGQADIDRLAAADEAR